MLYSIDDACSFFRVERTFFDAELRPRLPEIDLARPGAKKPMPRFRREDLEALAQSFPVRPPAVPLSPSARERSDAPLPSR